MFRSVHRLICCFAICLIGFHGSTRKAARSHGTTSLPNITLIKSAAQEAQQKQGCNLKNNGVHGSMILIWNVMRSGEVNHEDVQ